MTADIWHSDKCDILNQNQIVILKVYIVWVWNLVVDIAGVKEAKGVWEQGVSIVLPQLCGYMQIVIYF